MSHLPTRKGVKSLFLINDSLNLGNSFDQSSILLVRPSISPPFVKIRDLTPESTLSSV